MFICKTDRRLEGRFDVIPTFHRLPLELERYFNERAIAVYTDLVAYWSGQNGRRFVASSNRLNQSEEFINNQLMEANKELAFAAARQLELLSR